MLSRHSSCHAEFKIEEKGGEGRREKREEEGGEEGRGGEEGGEGETGGGGERRGGGMAA